MGDRGQFMEINCADRRDGDGRDHKSLMIGRREYRPPIIVKHLTLSAITGGDSLPVSGAPI